MPDKARSNKATTIVVAIVFTISVSGFFMGMRQTVSETADPVATAELHEAPQYDHGQYAVKTAVDYKDIAQAGFGPNAHFKSRLSSLDSTPQVHGEISSLLVSESTLRDKRNSRRAYDGAPPVVPHPITQDNAASCLQCHSKAKQIGDVVAPAISHPNYTSCTQCHVSGNYDAMTVERAYDDAPPTIPHTVHMRQNCMSCHGELGTSPIRTSHPDRQSCTQCHVPSAQIDKANFNESPFPLIEELVKAAE